MKELINTPSPIFDLDAELGELWGERRRQREQHRHRKAWCGQLPLRRGDVCLTRIVFSDAKGMKTRHAVVFGFQGRDVVMAPITSHEPRNGFDLAISYDCPGGRSGPWTLRCSKVTPVARSIIFRIAGHVATEDWPRVLQVTNSWFRSVVVGSADGAKFAA